MLAVLQWQESADSENISECERERFGGREFNRGVFAASALHTARKICFGSSATVY